VPPGPHLDRLAPGIPDPVVVVEYDPGWPAAFQRERERIGGALGDLAVAIEHMGSTAVPGLGAKPIIDIMLGLRGLEDVEACVGPMEDLGYEYKGEFGIPNRHYFRLIQGGLRTHQVHTVERGGEFWRRHLLFRDYLRARPDEAQRYYELKLGLAERHRDDREAYTEAKSEFILAAMERAGRDRSLSQKDGL
jgi:GrpB-like predicted nucleotidyltransferase (UPF0157 family)